MKKYIAKSNRYPVVSLDTDTNEVDIVDTDYVIDNIYLTKEAGEFYIDGKKVMDIADNDLLIKLYSLRDGEPVFITINDEKLIEYLNKRREEEKEEKKEISETVPCKNC